MNPQMMPFGNQPGGYAQPGNYTGSFSPPGGGPPPPSAGNPPYPRQFPQGIPQANIQQKNLGGPPTSMAPAGFISPAGPQGVPPPSEPLSGPVGYQNINTLPNSGSLNGLPTSMPQASGPPSYPSSNLSQQQSNPMNGPPASLGGHSVPQGPPISLSTGSLSGQIPHHISPTSHNQNSIPELSALQRGPGFQTTESLPGLPSHQGPPTSYAGSYSGPTMPSGLTSELPKPPTSASGSLIPPPAMSGPPGPLGPLSSMNVSQSPTSTSTPQSVSMGGPPGSVISSVRPQGMPNNGPPGPQGLITQSHMFSGPAGPQLNSAPRVIDHQFNSNQSNSSPSLASQPPGQPDLNKQFINGSMQGQTPGGSTMQHRPPFGYSSSNQRPPSVGPVRPSYPPMSSVNQQNPNMPPPQQQSSQLPYPPSQQVRPTYAPPMSNFNKPNYPGGPVPPQPNEMSAGYPQMSQGPYQQMSQPYSGINQGYPGMPPSGYPQQQSQEKPSRKLDPNMLPSPIQVMQDDEKNRSGIFYTEQKGLTPPLVTTNFVTQDQGNCSPRFVRSTTYSIPVTNDLLKQTSVPFALLISPLARLADGEHPPPIVNMGELGPVRCVRCKAYMSPFMQFIDGGRRFHCVFCKATTDVPAEYFQHLDHTGQRVDRFERPELVLGAYEYVATKDYCKNNQFAEPPAFVFVIDVSYNNVKSGLVHLLCSKMKEIIRNLPRDEGQEVSNMKVGFITYSNSVHFYNIKSCLAAPQMMLVGDVNEMFMPLLDGFLCDPVESEAVIDLLMQEIPKQFAETRETETILYPAIQAGLEALKASGCAGKLLVFHSSLPIAEAPGKLKNRDDRKVLNTDKEKSVLAPQNNSYNTLGQQCIEAGCCVDLFIFNNSYVDIATIGEVSRLTGGEIFKYTYFQADVDGDRFISDLKRDVSRQTAFDAMMRVRTSTGVRATDFYGHFYMANTKDMEFGAIDSDKAVGVEIKHDDKLTEEDGVYIQVALLYTSCGGQRRIRILNLSLKTCTQMGDTYRNCDLDTLVSYISKQGIFKLLESSPKQVKNDIMNRCANILACYRKNCATPSSTGQLILPECMKLLPLYVNSLLKCDAFSGGSDMTCDDRSFSIHSVMVMDLTVSVIYFYPRLVALHNINPDCYEPPAPIRCTYEKLQDDGVYLLDNGTHMFMWLGLNAPSSFISNVFGVPTVPQVDSDKPSLPALENSLSIKIREFIDETREKRHRSMRLTVVKQRDKMEVVFKQYLMEDMGTGGSPSYSDFLCHMHSQIRNILS